MSFSVHRLLPINCHSRLIHNHLVRRTIFNDSLKQLNLIQSRLAHRICLNYGDWDPVIGLEIHAQINSQSKLFSPSTTSYNSSTNSAVSFFDASLPGSLPVLNRRCVEAAILTGLSLNCTINSPTSFDRKHYFYPDLPSGYQITQSREPVAVNGYLDFCTYNKYLHEEAYNKRSVIKQIQLEQDSGRTLVHDESNTCLIDLNRAGIGLMELVFEPDLNDGEEAVCLVKDLIMILKSINTCSCKLEEGCLRVDANISVRRKCECALGVRTEVKNLNSLRTISKAIDYEIRRQIDLLENGKEVVNETRTFDTVHDVTVVMRDKEVDNDYRFMPEPNLPPLWFADSGKGGVNGSERWKTGLIDINDFRKQLRTSPSQERQELIEKYGTDLTTAFRLLTNQEFKEMFIQVMDQRMDRDPAIVVELLFGTIESIIEERKETLSDSKLTVTAIGDVADMIQSETISLGTASDLLMMTADGLAASDNLKNVVQENEWFLINDEKEIESWCKQVIEEKPKRAKEYKKGKKFAENVLLLIIKKKTLNRINERDARDMFDKLLKPPPIKEDEEENN